MVRWFPHARSSGIPDSTDSDTSVGAPLGSQQGGSHRSGQGEPVFRLGPGLPPPIVVSAGVEAPPRGTGTPALALQGTAAQELRCPCPGRGVRGNLRGDRDRRHPDPDRIRPAGTGERRGHSGLCRWVAPPPPQGETSNILSRAITDRRGIRLVIAILPAFIVVQIVAAALHIGYVGAFGWPVFVAAGMVILIWRNASEKERAWINHDLMPMLHAGDERRWRSPLVARIAVGIGLGVARAPRSHPGTSIPRRAATDRGLVAGDRGDRRGLRPLVVEFGSRPDVGTSGPGDGR